MGSLVYTNGRLSKISQAGGGDNYDTDLAAGPDRWTGDVGITVRQRHVEQIAGGRIDRVDEAHLVLPYDVGVQVQQGDLLAFTDDEGFSHVRKAGTTIPAKLTGRFRVNLQDA
jgi:hypothetical protein